MTHLPARIPVTAPFARYDLTERNVPDPDYVGYFNEKGRPDFPDSDSSGISIEGGVPASFAEQTSIGEPLKFDRHMMNQIGFLATQGVFRNQFGYKPTFNKDVSDRIGGYAKGAILAFGKYEVISLQDDNKVDFTDGSYEVGKKLNGKVWWAYVQRDRSFSILPDLRTGKVVYSRKVDAGESGVRIGFVTVGSGWYCLCFTPANRKPDLENVGYVLASEVDIHFTPNDICVKPDSISQSDEDGISSLDNIFRDERAIVGGGLIPMFAGSRIVYAVDDCEDGLFEIYKFENYNEKA